MICDILLLKLYIFKCGFRFAFSIFFLILTYLFINNFLMPQNLEVKVYFFFFISNKNRINHEENTNTANTRCS